MRVLPLLNISWDSSKGIIMNVKQLILATAILASAGGAMAVEATQWNPPAGGLSRAEVKADLARATAAGELVERGEAYAGLHESQAPATTLARTEVKQELARARANGELEDRGEAYGSFHDAHPQYRGPVFAWRKPHASNNALN
jgi:hypothetical protein